MCNITEKKKDREKKNMISWMSWFQVDLTSVKTTLQVKEKGLVILKVARSILVIIEQPPLSEALSEAHGVSSPC